MNVARESRLPQPEPARLDETGADSDRRDSDRRQITTTRLAASLVYGHRFARRRHAQRQDDRQGYYVDWYEPHILYLTMSVLLLSCADALMTLSLLERGASELNAFMQALIETDVQLFAALKMAFTGAGLLFLVIHHRFRVFRRFRVDQLLRAVLLLYLLLIGYELALLQPMNAPSPALVIVSVGAALGIAGLFCPGTSE